MSAALLLGSVFAWKWKDDLERSLSCYLRIPHYKKLAKGMVAKIHLADRSDSCRMWGVQVCSSLLDSALREVRSIPKG